MRNRSNPSGSSRPSNRSLDLMNVKYLVANSYTGSAERLLSRPDRFRLIRKDGSRAPSSRTSDRFREPSSSLRRNRSDPGRPRRPRADRGARLRPGRSGRRERRPRLARGGATAPGRCASRRIQSEFGETSVDAELESNASPRRLGDSLPGLDRARGWPAGSSPPGRLHLPGGPLGPGTHTVRFRYVPASFRHRSRSDCHLRGRPPRYGGARLQFFRAPTRSMKSLKRLSDPDGLTRSSRLGVPSGPNGDASRHRR